MAANRGGPLGRPRQGGEYSQGCALARTVGTEQAEYLTLPDVKRNVIESHEVIEFLRQALNPNHGVTLGNAVGRDERCSAQVLLSSRAAPPVAAFSNGA